MKNKSKIYLFVGVLIFIFGFIFLYQLDVKNASYNPVVAYGEYPFSLEYEKDGQRFVINDTLVVGKGKYNDYLGAYLKSDTLSKKNEGENFILYRGEELTPSLRDGDGKLVFQKVKLMMDYAYFLESEYPLIDLSKLQWVVLESTTNDANNWDNNMPAVKLNTDELYSNFGIKLISWTNPPIPLTIQCDKRSLFGLDRTYSYAELQKDRNLYERCFHQ
jgi:hypothetical protein